MTYESPYVARVIRTDKLIFSAPTHDPQSPTDGWYSTDDGTSRDCALVMDNETFLRMLKNGEVEYVQVPVAENQLSMFEG